jgi:hypothetical protein
MKKILKFIEEQMSTKPFGGFIGIGLILIFVLLMLLNIL